MSRDSLTPSDGLCDPLDFCRACSRFATGVTVITVRDDSGLPHGITVNSFSSVSLDPLLFLVCIDHRSRLRSILLPGVPVAANILAEHQQNVSRAFARPTEDRFGSLDWTPNAQDVPLIDGALANIEGTVREVIVAGDHAIVLIHVHATNYREGRPLVFFNSRYQQLGEINS